MLKIALRTTLPLLLAGTLAQAAETVTLNASQTQLGFGAGEFPIGTRLSEDGDFLVTLPSGLTIESATFSENYDMMCDVQPGDLTGLDSFLFQVGPSSAEASQCVLELRLDDGQVRQVIGSFASGD